MPKTTDQDCQLARPYRLDNPIQNYMWGTRGERAFIAHLTGLDTPADVPVAELWIGAHPSAPSSVIDPVSSRRIGLDEWLNEDPVNRLGDSVYQNFGASLPYLFKVLSADMPLSIQAHPGKADAVRLHDRAPEHYPDNNHKPEIAIALDHLDALVGFIKQEEFETLLQTYPALLQLSTEVNSSLGNFVDHILELAKANSHLISACNLAIQKQIGESAESGSLDHLFLSELNKYGPEDVGLLFIYLLQRMHLAPGEAVFLAPGVPHAYLKGNIIECMANSDNVVRVGLTPKHRDVQALQEIIDYDTRDLKVETSSDGYLTEYLTPTEEFKVRRLALVQGESRAFSYRTSLSTFIVTEGEIALKWGTADHVCSCMYRRGDVFVVPANLKQFTIQAKHHCKLFFVDIPV